MYNGLGVYEWSRGGGQHKRGPLSLLYLLDIYFKTNTINHFLGLMWGVMEEISFSKSSFKKKKKTISLLC